MSSLTSFILFAIAAAVVPLVLFRWFAPRRTAARQPALEFGVTVEAAGFLLADLRPHPVADVRMAWAEVGRVVAYKRDRFLYDRVCVFVARADGSGVELNEEMDGWTEFCETLPRVLPGCQTYEAWFVTVVFPAFATNKTELYVRP